MALSVLSYYLALMISFFLFYFNVPYWTGRDMADMSKSGIWRAFFRFLSFLGYGLHKIYGTIIGSVMQWVGLKVFKGREQEHNLPMAIIQLIYVLASVGTLFLITSFYNSFIDSFFPSNISSLADGGEGLLGRISQFLVFIRVAISLKPASEAWSVGTVVASIITTLIALVLYVIINTLYFAILYGFLREMLIEIDMSDRIPFLRIGSASPDYESDGGGFRNLGAKLLDALRNFCNKMTIMWCFQNPLTVVLFAVLALLFSIVMVKLGKNDLTFVGVFKEVLDSIGVVQIVISFFITYLVGKCTEKTASAVVQHLPEGVQKVIHSASAKGNEWADLQDMKRHAWAQSNSEVYTAPVSVEPQEPASSSSAYDVHKTVYRDEEYPATIAGIVGAAQACGVTATSDDVRRILQGDSEVGRAWRELSGKSIKEKSYFLSQNAPAIIEELKRQS